MHDIYYTLLHGCHVYFRAILSGRPHAYIKCCRSSKLRPTLASIVAQLSGSKRKRTQAYAAAAGTQAALVWELQDLCPPTEACRVVVLDDVSSLLTTAGIPMLNALLKLRDQACAHVALLLISSQDGCSSLLHQLPPMHEVPFPQYTDRELLAVLMKDKPSEEPEVEVYEGFLKSVVFQALKLDRCLADVQAIAKSLWRKYIATANKQQMPRPLSDDHITVLYEAIEEPLLAVLRSVEPGAVASTLQLIQTSNKRLYGGMEQPQLAKFLIIAAFLASRNRPSVDKQLFEHSIAKGRRTGGARKAMGQDRQAEAAKEAQLKGPHNFTLQRLMNIYRMLRRADPHSEQQGLAATTECGSNRKSNVSLMDVDSADIMMQVSSLVSARVLSQVGRGWETGRMCCS
eukprot:jgi/Chrzof1/7802/Cz02g37040.t1